MSDRETLLSLAARCETATGPSDQLDVDIFFEVVWEGQGDERRALAFTASLDAALTLVPEGWFWRCGRTSLFVGWAFVSKTHPDHGEPGRNEFGASKEPWQGEWTTALALCTAALRARAAECAP